MTVTLEGLQEVQGKTLTVKLVGEEPAEFQLTGAMPQGIVLYQKKAGPRLVEIGQIESFEAKIEAPKEPKVKTLRPVNEDTISKHLLDAHGATIDWIMATSTEEQLAFHEDIHSKYRLGHQHGSKEKSPAEAAADQAGEASAESSADSASAA